MKLHTVVIRYVDFRKSLGERFQTNEKVLKSFCRPLRSRIEVDGFQWRADAFLACEYSALAGFHRYALALGDAKNSSPNGGGVILYRPRCLWYKKYA
jgi:hypothetical protein